jgi:hypothetical protein
LDAAIADVQKAIQEKKDAAALAATSKKKRAVKRPAAAVIGEDIEGNARKRPSADCGSAKPAKVLPPSLQDVKTRQCMTARTGIPGPGMSKTISYRDGTPAAARKAASTWLKQRCHELGIRCEL